MPQYKNAYTMRAKPEVVKGVLYDSKLEATVARILLGNRVTFSPHIKFPLQDYRGKVYSYTPDFIFPEAQNFIGIEKSIHVLEVKGVIVPHDIKRMEDLEYQYGVKGFVATATLIHAWQKYGFLKKPRANWVEATQNAKWISMV